MPHDACLPHTTWCTRTLCKSVFQLEVYIHRDNLVVDTFGNGHLLHDGCKNQIHMADKKSPYPCQVHHLQSQHQLMPTIAKFELDFLLHSQNLQHLSKCPKAKELCCYR